MIEQRQSQRRVLKTRAVLTVDGAAPAVVRTIDIGNSGISVAMDSPVRVGSSASIACDLFVEGKSTPLSARAKAAYCIFSGGEFKVGFSFLNVDIAALATIAKYLK